MHIYFDITFALNPFSFLVALNSIKEQKNSLPSILVLVVFVHHLCDLNFILSQPKGL